ncbi:MAG: hypothetical protein AB1324_06685 [Candidatus Micrarchaeota archaeon]
MRHALLLMSLLALASAHLEGGTDFESGPYILDLGWEPGELRAGEPAFFAVNVVDNDTEEPSNLSSVWVRFSKGEAVAFAGTFALERGSTSFTYEFPEGGDWDMDVRFGDRSEKAALEVTPADAPDNYAWWAAAALAILSIALALRLVSKK